MSKILRQILDKSLNRTREGNVDNGSAAKSSRRPQEVTPDGSPSSKDDSVVYSESRSKSGTKHRPKRRGESFNLRATNRDRPQSWQAGSPGLNPGKPRSRRSFESRQSASVSEVNRLPSASSVNNATSSESVTTTGSTSSGQERVGGGMHHGSRSTSSLHYYPNSGVSPGTHPSMHPSDSWHGDTSAAVHSPPHAGMEQVGYTPPHAGVEQVGFTPPSGQARSMHKSYSYSNARERPPSWDGQPPAQRPPYGSDQALDHDPRHTNIQDLRYPYHHQRTRNKGYTNNYENLNEFAHDSSAHAAPGRPGYSEAAHGTSQLQAPPPAGATNATSAFAADRRSPSPPLPPVRDASSLKFKVSQSHEKYPSWPVSAEQNAGAREPMSGRTTSLVDHTHTGAEFPSKPHMAYHTELSTHAEERLGDTPETARKYFEENGVQKPGVEPRSHFHQAVVDKLHQQGDLDIRQNFPINSQGELDMKNFKNEQPSYPHPRYDKDGKMKDIDKDYAAPSPPERDVPSEQQREPGAPDTGRQWGQYPRHPSGDKPPPLPATGPPAHAATAASDASQSFTSSAQVSIGTTGARYPLVVKSRPYYNTSTQTDTGEGGGDALERRPPQRVEKSVQVREKSLLGGVNLEEIPAIHDKAAAAPTSPAPVVMANAATSPKESVPSVTFNSYPPPPREHRSAPIVDRLQQEKRIPETISENEEARPGAVGPGAARGRYGLRRDELERIHEHSPNQTSMLRKLSQELYYGQQTRYGMGMTNRMHSERKASGDSPLKETQRPADLTLEGSDAGNAAPAAGEPNTESPKSPLSPKVSPFERGNKVQMSLRKAYGIFDEIENYDPAVVGRKHLGKHAKSASTIHMSSGPAPNAVAHKTQASLDGKGNYADYAEVGRVQQWQKSPAGGMDTHLIAEQARQDWTESGKYKAYENNNSSGRLKRTTSEQIRPIKERVGAHHHHPVALRKDSKHKLSDPESAQEKRHKISDPVPPHTEGSGAGDRGPADPNSGAPLTHKEKRLSDSSDVFLRNSGGGFEGGVNRRHSGARSSGSASSIDERHRQPSDPDLKKFQHHALLSFYEKKTGKRLSSSSMESAVSGGERSALQQLSPSPLRPEDGRKGYSLPPGVAPPTPGDAELSPPLLLDTTSAADRASYHSRSSSQSVTSPGVDYSPPLHPWGQPSAPDPKRNPMFGTPNKNSLPGSAETSPASTLVIHHSKQNSEENNGLVSPHHAPDDPSTHPKALMAQESSSTSSTPNRPTSQEYNQKFGFQVTLNQSYDDEDKPPTLPPRNYRQPLADRNARERPQPPPPPTNPPPRGGAELSTHSHSFRSNVMTNDYDQTPKPDMYADQLRQQSRRISQGPRGFLNPARFQQKSSLPDMKTSISVSRPVDRMPTAQETSTPQPLLDDIGGMVVQPHALFRSTAVPQTLFVESSQLSSNKSPESRLSDSRHSNASSHNSSANNSPRPADSPMQPHAASPSQRSPGGPGSSPGQPHTPHSYLSETAIPPRALSAELNGMERRPDGHSPENSTAHQLYTTESYIHKKSGNVRRGFGGNYRRSGELSPVKTPVSPNLLPECGDEAAPFPGHTSPLGDPALVASPPGHVRYEETDLDRPHEKRYIEAPPGELPWQKVKVVHAPKMDFMPQHARHAPHGHAGEPGLLAEERADPHHRYPPSQNLRHAEDDDADDGEVQSYDSPSVKSFAANFESGRFSPKPFDREARPKLEIKTKVSELRETILRRSNENLLQAVELSGSRERLNRLSPATSRDRLDKLAGSSTNSSQEFKERVENKNSINMHNQTGSDYSGEPRVYTGDPATVTDISRSPPARREEAPAPPETVSPSVSPPRAEHQPAEDEVFVKHARQKSQEEMVYEQQAAILASQLREKDKQLSEVIQPPPGRKMSVDYMSGLFKKEVKLNRRPSFLSSRPPGDGSEDVQPPPDVGALYNEENSAPEFSLETQMEQLASSLENKLRILRQDKQAFADEMKENGTLGAMVTSIVEKKAQQRECSKYKSYVDELDKVMHLLIFLSDKLAKAENDLLSLPSDASDAQREGLVKRREQMYEKHEDAKSLKEGIDRRSRQVATYLKTCLTDDEFTDYQYFIQMKSKLNMEKQEIDDKIKLGEEQLKAVHKSLDISEA